jgi:hypothetical protein
MKRGNKKGQFYLLAAIIIITVIIGFAAISNYAKKKTTVKLYDIKDELQIESGEVLEHGISEEKDIENLIDDFIEKYQEYAGENRNLYFIFGNTKEVWMVSFEEIIRGRITETGGTGVDIPGVRYEKKPLEIEGGRVVATIIDAEGNEIEYEFKLNPGQNFFFVISQEVEGEQHIVIG